MVPDKEIMDGANMHITMILIIFRIITNWTKILKNY